MTLTTIFVLKGELDNDEDVKWSDGDTDNCIDSEGKFIKQRIYLTMTLMLITSLVMKVNSIILKTRVRMMMILISTLVLKTRSMKMNIRIK